MKTILRLSLVVGFFLLLNGEPPRQVEAEVAQPVDVIKAEAPKVVDTTSVAPTSTPEPPKPPVVNTSEQDAKMFIYFKESGNRLDAVNSIGCIGLGQDCNGALAKQCPNWKTDRTCQDLFWEKYMQRRYGTWQKAKTFWLAKVPINGKNVGHWW